MLICFIGEVLICWFVCIGIFVILGDVMVLLGSCVVVYMEWLVNVYCLCVVEYVVIYVLLYGVLVDVVCGVCIVVFYVVGVLLGLLLCGGLWVVVYVVSWVCGYCWVFNVVDG